LSTHLGDTAPIYGLKLNTFPNIYEQSEFPTFYELDLLFYVSFFIEDNVGIEGKKETVYVHDDIVED
jgi:hypothetical protein